MNGTVSDESNNFLPTTAGYFAQTSGADMRGSIDPEKNINERDSRKFNALLVEDNHADALLIEEAIEAHALPINLHRVTDGQKAFDFLKQAEEDPDAPCPQLLLLDLNLPKRSGKEVLERVRRSEKCKDIPVLIITSSDSRRTARRWRSSGSPDISANRPATRNS